MSDGETPTLETLAVGTVPDEVLEASADAIDEYLPVDTTVRDDSIGIDAVEEFAYRSESGRYRAEELLDFGDERREADLALVVTDVDLTYRRREYVFGLGYLNGTTAAFSIHRLDPAGSTDSTPTDGSDALSDRFRARVRKEAVKQAGILLGHDGGCIDDECVFTHARTVSELDETGESPSDVCARAIESGEPVRNLEGSTAQDSRSVADDASAGTSGSAWNAVGMAGVRLLVPFYTLGLVVWRLFRVLSLVALLAVASYLGIRIGAVLFDANSLGSGDLVFLSTVVVGAVLLGVVVGVLTSR